MDEDTRLIRYCLSSILESNVTTQRQRNTDKTNKPETYLVVAASTVVTRGGTDRVDDDMGEAGMGRFANDWGLEMRT